MKLWLKEVTKKALNPMPITEYFLKYYFEKVINLFNIKTTIELAPSIYFFVVN